MRCSGYRREGITLLETLVVISLAGIILALLVPAVSLARAAALRVQCVNHLRQVGMGLIHHESIHRKLPDFGHTTRDDWAIAILPLVEREVWNNPNDFQFSGLATSLKQCPPIFQCPVNQSETPELGVSSNGHFGINPLVANRTVASIQPSFQTILAGELPKGVGIPWFSSPALIEADLGFHHGGTTNAVFVDGHVESVDSLRLEHIKK